MEAAWKTRWKEAMEEERRRTILSPSARTRRRQEDGRGYENKSNATETWNKSNERAAKQPAGSEKGESHNCLDA